MPHPNPVQDCWPFGYGIQQRTFVASGVGIYRYGFNGKEESGELSSGHYTTEFRELDSQTGRWWGVDPKSADRQGWSPYNVMSNSPVVMVDPRGDADFYNRRGRYIGTDGIADGRRYMALVSSTSRQIKRQMLENLVVTLPQK
jgi:RHS repeat-associated protein